MRSSFSRLLEHAMPRLAIGIIIAVLAVVLVFAAAYLDARKRHARDPVKNINPHSTGFLLDTGVTACVLGGLAAAVYYMAVCQI